jgi:predicted nucleic acid-binding protein
MIDLPSPVYWDANLFLAYLEKTPDQFASIAARLAQTQRHAIPIYTAAVSVTEVAFFGAERTRGVLDPMIPDRLAALWDDALIRVIDVTFPVALAARDLVRRSLLDGPRLRPIDAIHLAAAASVLVHAFYSYDRSLHRHSRRYGFVIADP